MTVTAVTPNVQYTITSANVSSLADSHTSVTFAVTFKYLATSEVVVTKTRAGVDTTLTETTHYTLSAAGASGTMTFVDSTAAALFAADDLITFTRSMTFSQATDYAVNDLLDAETLEQNFDKPLILESSVTVPPSATDNLHLSALSSPSSAYKPIFNPAPSTFA